MHIFFFFFFNDTATTEIYTLSLHDALPIFLSSYPTETPQLIVGENPTNQASVKSFVRSEEHTSELQSPCNLVCRLLLEKKKLHRTPCLSQRCRITSSSFLQTARKSLPFLQR